MLRSTFLFLLLTAAPVLSASAEPCTVPDVWRENVSLQADHLLSTGHTARRGETLQVLLTLVNHGCFDEQTADIAAPLLATFEADEMESNRILAAVVLHALADPSAIEHMRSAADDMRSETLRRVTLALLQIDRAAQRERVAD